MSKDYLVVKLEEAERLGIEARETGKYWARIGWYVDKPGGEKEAVVDIFDPRRGHDLVTFPEQQANGVVKIINNAHEHLDILLGAYVANDPERAVKYVRKLFRTIRKARRVGRPKLAETNEERVTRYFDAHGLEATCQKFNLRSATVLQYDANVRRKKRSI